MNIVSRRLNWRSWSSTFVFLLSVLCAGAAATDASFVENGGILNLTLMKDGVTVTITATAPSYTFALSTGSVWSGTDSGNVSGNGTFTLTVTSAGKSAFITGINLIDGTNKNETVNFADSASNQYSNSIFVTLANSGGAIGFSGTTSFTGSGVSLGASSSGALTVASGSTVSTGGAFSSVTLQAKGAVTITNSTINSVLGVQLAADVDANTMGDDGIGTLSINGSSTVLGQDIVLIGADIDIAATATIGNSISTTEIAIQTSLLTLPMSIGGSNNAVTGVNLTGAELGTFTTYSGGNIRFGDTDFLYGGNVTFVTATPAKTAGAGVIVNQDPKSNAKILLDTGGSALSCSGLVQLNPGTGGIQVGQSITDTPLTTKGFTATGITLTLTLSSAPIPGNQYTIISNTDANANLIKGTFSNLPDGGLITSGFGGVTYTFAASYSGGDGNDLVLTNVAAPIAATLPPTSVFATNLTMNGNVTANGLSTALSFEYGLTASYGTTVSGNPSPINGFSSTPITASATNLLPSTTYHYRVDATNALGTTLGSDTLITTPSNNNNLAGLTISRGALNPSFDPMVTTYSVVVSTNATGITFTPFTADPNASVSYSEMSVLSGMPSPVITLTGSGTSIPVTVFAQDGTSKTYTINVTQTTLPATTTTLQNASVQFSSSLVSFANVSASVTTSGNTVTDGFVTIQVVGGNNPSSVPLMVSSNGMASGSIVLPVAFPAGTYPLNGSYGGSNNFDISSDSAHTLTVTPAPSFTTPLTADVNYSLVAQNVALNASVTSPAGVVNEGSVNFQVLDSTGRNLIGSAVVAPSVVNGSAQVQYSIPAGTAAGVYNVRATFIGSTNYSLSGNNMPVLTVHPLSSTVVPSTATIPFSFSSQNVTLSATVTAAGGAVNQGTVTFQVFNGTVSIGSAVTSPTVSNGAASVSYPIPNGFPAGAYTLVATYNGAPNYASSSDNTQTVNITAASTFVTTADLTALYSTAITKATFTASLTSPVGNVSGGMVTFQVANTAGNVGTAVVSTIVLNGQASVTYAIPAGTDVGTYTIALTYSGAQSFAPSSDKSHKLTITIAPSSLVVGPANSPVDVNPHNTVLTASVQSRGLPVNEGTVSFQVMNGKSPLGAAVTSPTVANGVATATYVVPAGTPVGTYQIVASYSGSTHFSPILDNTHNLNVNLPQPAITSPLTATGVQGLPFSYQITGTNNPTGFSAKGLPGGLTIDVATGIISGTPTAAADTTVVIGASNISGADSQMLVISISANQAPVVSALNSDQNPGLINQPVMYAITATDADTPMLGYTFNFGDGSADLTGTFPQGTVVTLSHVYTAYTVGVTVTLTVTDGFTPVTQTVVQTIPMPATGDIPNILTNQPPIVTPAKAPLGGLSVGVMNSDGGVIQLNIDDSKIGMARSSYDLSTDWGDITGRASKATGSNPVHQYVNHGLYTATTTATQKGTGTLIGKARITIPISTKETGEAVTHVNDGKPGPFATATSSTGIVTKSIKGKFAFNASTTDLVTYSGTITLGAGLTIGQPHEFWIGIGNIVVETTLDKNGKGTVPGNPAILKSLSVAFKGKKGSVTVGGETATITVIYSTKNMIANGFDTEGISKNSTDVSKTMTAQRNIQVAMLLDGVPFQSVTPVNFGVTSNADFGTISGRAGK